MLFFLVECFLRGLLFLTELFLAELFLTGLLVARYRLGGSLGNLPMGYTSIIIISM